MKQEKKGSVLSCLFAIAQQGKGKLIISCFSSVLGAVLGVLPYASVYFIAETLLVNGSSTQTNNTIIFWAIIAGISIIGNMLFSFLGSYGAHKVAFEILYGFRIRVMEHLGKVPLGFFAKQTTGSIQKTMEDNIEKIEGFIAHMLPDLVSSFVILIGLFIVLFIANLWLAVVVIVAIVLSMVTQFSMFGGKKGRQLWEMLAKATQDTTGAFSEYVKGMAEVKLFGLSGTMSKKLIDNVELYRTWELRQYKITAMPYIAYKTIVLSLLTVILPVAVILVSRDSSNYTIILAVLMAFIITPALYDPLMTCISYGSQLGQLAVGLDAIDQILESPLIVEPSNPQQPDNYTISFHDVTFSYQEHEDENKLIVLDTINFEAKQKQLTALVGPSGGGKSTVAQLLARFWEVHEGTIQIGGVDIKDIKQENLMDLISVVFQDTYIFSGTIKDNLTMDKSYTSQEIEAAATTAKCHEFIMNLPNGYDTKVGDGGHRLSGGEAQRLAIARAMLKDAPIIVMDEALAYADAENENLIQKAISKLIENKTVIVIAHRLQTIQDADQILLLNNGVIEEKGTHKELMDRDTLYKELWNLQHEADDWTIEVEEVVV